MDNQLKKDICRSVLFGLINGLIVFLVLQFFK